MSAPDNRPAPDSSDQPLSPEELDRYSRHLRLKEVGLEGQTRLLKSRVLVVGVGGLGSPVALYLAAAGVGTLGLLDDDQVSLSNLQRQVLYQTQDVGRPKVEAARRRLLGLNPDIQVVAHPARLTAENAMELLARYDLVVNGSDNFPTRYLLSDACTLLSKPLVDASVAGFSGQVTAFLPGEGCYRCLFPTPPPPDAVPTCSEGGVLGALTGQLGAIQALEAIKILLGIGRSLSGRLLLVDALAGETQEISWARNPSCPACGDEPGIRDLSSTDYLAFCGLAPLRRSPVGPSLEGRLDLTPQEVRKLLDEGRVRLIDVREPWEYSIHRIPEAELIPLSRFRHQIGAVNRDEDVVIVCEHGHRSVTVVDSLRRSGMGRTYNLVGGMEAWVAENLPTQRGS